MLAKKVKIGTCGLKFKKLVVPKIVGDGVFDGSTCNHHAFRHPNIFTFVLSNTLSLTNVHISLHVCHCHGNNMSTSAEVI